MKNLENSTSRIRKEYRKADGRTQKMVSFRLDNELLYWLESQQNKGRYLNELIREDMEREGQ